MPRPKPAKGTRTPGSGRKRGTPNRITVELKTLIAQLANDPAYQSRLRQDFRRRRVHPTIEALVWHHVAGKPAEHLALSGELNVTGRIEEERRAFAALDLADMEQLAAESQRLVDRALMLSRTRLGEGTTQDVVVEAEAIEEPAETLGKTHELSNGIPIIRPTSDEV